MEKHGTAGDVSRRPNEPSAKTPVGQDRLRDAPLWLRADTGIGRNNALALMLMAALPALIGSAVSVLLGVFFAWAIISLVLGRFPWRLTRSDRFAATVFTIFAAAIVATALMGANRELIFGAAYWLLPFLSLWVIIPRVRASPEVDNLGAYITGAAFGAIAAFIVAVLQVAITGGRPEAGSGNAAVFAMMSMQLALIAGLNIDHPDKRLARLAAIATFLGMGAAMLSLTRGVALAALPLLVLLFLYAPRAWLRRRWIVATALVAILSVGLFFGAKLFSGRLDQTIQELTLVLMGEHSKNVGERLRLWTAGLEVVVNAPVWGYGIQNRMETIAGILARDGLPVRDFTHPHNGFLTVAVDSGLVGLAALVALLATPVVIAWRAPRDDRYRKRLHIALFLSLGYALCGMTQIMFNHDIMDSFFIFTTIVIAASIPDASSKASERFEAGPSAPAPGVSA